MFPAPPDYARDARRHVSVIPRRCGPISGACLVTHQLLDHVGFSDHALERFAERAGLPYESRAVLEPVVRDLLLQEGLRVGRPPRWARLREPAPLYLQAGFWLLFVGRPNPRGGPDGRTITTVINASPDRTWAKALERGDIATPLPRLIARPTLERAALRSSIASALAGHPSPLRVLGAIVATHRRHQEEAELAYARALADWERAEREHKILRARANEEHLVRHGFVRRRSRR